MEFNQKINTRKPMKKKIAVIIPTIRPELFDTEFWPAWEPLFRLHECAVYRVLDGETPRVQRWKHDSENYTPTYKVSHMPTKWQDIAIEIPDCIYNFTDAVRNLGFLAAKHNDDPDIYISLDDDVLPIEDVDAIRRHAITLSSSVQLDWVNTADGPINMRGVPYRLPEYPVLLSHGMWRNVPDLDAIQQLQWPDLRNVEFNHFHIPRHVFFPVCAMNFAFRKELLPYAYQAPMGRKLLQDGLEVFDRFADIWAGLVMKYAIDNVLNGAAVSGFSIVEHRRASNVWANLRKEAPGMELNETMYKYMPEILGHVPPLYSSLHPYVTLYSNRLRQWQKLVQ
jgi:hypothetical protein